MRLWLALFLLVAAVQLVVPASVIVDHELTLKQGRRFKLRTAPVDPVDAFRGRYVALAFDIQQYETTEPYRDGAQLSAVLREAADGFAEIGRLSADPVEGDSALLVTVEYGDSSMVRLRLPFDRFYLDEDDAPRAERAVRDADMRTQLESWAAVRIRGERAVIEQLYLGDRTIQQFLREQPE